MIEKLEALAALRSSGTMGQAASALRITQSAVSKRIAALEAELGERLIERQGRRVRLTGEAEHLLAEARPLLASLREVLRARSARRRDVLRIAATDSLLASWLPATLRAALDRLPDLGIELHAHRGPALLERVRSGDYTLGFGPVSAGDKELMARELGREPMVVVPSGLEPIAPSATLAVWSIETQSLTWEAIAPRLGRSKRVSGMRIEVVSRLESFTALVQVARAGFAHALVPIGVARDLGVPVERLLRLDLSRPIGAVARRKAFEHHGVRALLAQLAGLWPAGGA